MGTFLAYRELSELCCLPPEFSKETEKEIQIKEMYSLRELLTPDQINFLFANEPYIAPYFLCNIRDALYSRKHVALDDEFWKGHNPLFPEDMISKSKN